MKAAAYKMKLEAIKRQGARTDLTSRQDGGTVALSNNFYGWVFASGGKMRILGPEKAVEGFKVIIGDFITGT